jgi:hypothetical protein
MSIFGWLALAMFVLENAGLTHFVGYTFWMLLLICFECIARLLRK